MNDDKEIVAKIIKGFELIPSKNGFGHPYTTKTGQATTALVTRINQWVQQQFPYSNVRVRLEATYKTLNFYRAN